MTSLNSRLQLALLNRKNGRNLLEKGFTLVELMIVIVIVGILSAVALPQFLGLRDKAETGAVVGSMAGLAKECASGQLLGSATTTNASAGSDITVSGDCDGTANRTLTNANLFAAGSATGLSCSNAVAGATDRRCTITVDTNGVITGAWSAS